MTYLKGKIRNGRQHGLLTSKRNQRDATIAINLYLNATKRTGREEVRELMRMSNRWAALPGRYPLLLTTFTNIAKRIIYVIFQSATTQ